MTKGKSSLGQYVKGIKKLPLLTRKEEVELAAKIKKGDRKSRDKLIVSNLRLVVKISHDFKGFGLPLEDLVAEGNIGLMKAAEKYDPAKGAKFSSYSAWWIKQSMRRAIDEKSRDVRIPVVFGRNVERIKKIENLFREEYGREPREDEVLVLLNSSGKEYFTERKLKALRLYAPRKQISFEDPIEEGEEGMFQDLIPDKVTGFEGVFGSEEQLDDGIKQQLRELLKTLDKRDQKILRMRFGFDGDRPKTLEETASKIKRTRERVRQIQNRALLKLKKKIIQDWGARGPQNVYEVLERGLELKVEGVRRKSSRKSRNNFNSKPKWIPYINLPNLTNEELLLVDKMNLAKGINYKDLAKRLGWSEERVRFEKEKVDEKTDEFLKFKLAFITGNYYDSNRDPSQSLLYAGLSCLDDLSEFNAVVDEMVPEERYNRILRSLYCSNGSSQTIEELAESRGEDLEDLKYEEYAALNYLASQIGIDPFIMANAKKKPYKLTKSLDQDEKYLIKEINDSEEEISFEELGGRMGWGLERVIICRRSAFNKIVDDYFS